MASFLGQLQANDALQAKLTGQEDTVPTWLRSHPRTVDRVQAASEATAEASPGAREQNRDRFLAAIDGMIYGDDPAQGFVRGTTFEHPDLGFRFTAPDGFVLRNTPAAVIGRDRQGRFMSFDMGEGSSRDPETYLAREWARETRVTNLEALLVGGLAGAAALAQVQVNRQPAEAYLAAVEAGGGRYFRFMFADPRGLGRSDIADFEASVQTLRRLRPGEATIEPLRIDIHTVRSGESQESVAHLMQIEKLPLETFRVLSGLSPGANLEAGQKVKIVVKG